jgi:hypothetical protein
VLKIDRSFVGRMTEGEQPLQIVRTIVELARVLGMDVVAEGYRDPRAVPPAAGSGLPLRSGISVRPSPACGGGHGSVAPAGPLLPDPEASMRSEREPFAGADRLRSPGFILGTAFVFPLLEFAMRCMEFLKVTSGRGMLHSMQQTAAQIRPPPAPSFAGLLAALTAPAPKTAWNNDDLAEDVATLSYEHALRAPCALQAADPGDWGVCAGRGFPAAGEKPRAKDSS